MSNDLFDERRQSGIVLTPSRALVSAALGGLLCVGSPACSSGDGAEQTHALSDAAADHSNTAGAAGSLPGDSSDGTAARDSTFGTASDSAAGSGGAMSDSAAGSGETSATDALAATDSAPLMDAAPTCDAMPDTRVVTSSTVVTDMTLEKFTADCAALAGILEIHPHCGGSNSCKGMSYDTGTQTLIEHTCKGLNTCAGYSCIIC